MIVLLGLLTNLDGAEQAGGVGVSEPRAVGGVGRAGRLLEGGGGVPGGRWWRFGVGGGGCYFVFYTCLMRLFYLK